MKNAIKAYGAWDNYNEENTKKRVDVVVTHENKVQTTADYRESLKKEEVPEVQYPATKSNFSLYLERSI